MAFKILKQNRLTNIATTLYSDSSKAMEGLFVTEIYMCYLGNKRDNMLRSLKHTHIHTCVCVFIFILCIPAGVP